MSILAEAQKYGIQFEIIGNTVKARATRPVPLEVAKKFKERKSEIIRLLKNQNNKQKYPAKPQHRCPACKERNWWLSRYGVWTCRICHPPGPGAEVEPEAYRSLQEQNVDLCTSQESRPDRRYCTGYKPARYVHLEACKWHIAEGDPKCANCPHLTLKDKENLMDSYLDKAIEKLNAHCAVYYKPTDPPARRALINKLEAQITNTFLVHDINAFIKNVDRWVKCFKGGVDHD